MRSPARRQRRKSLSASDKIDGFITSLFYVFICFSPRVVSGVFFRVIFAVVLKPKHVSEHTVKYYPSEKIAPIYIAGQSNHLLTFQKHNKYCSQKITSISRGQNKPIYYFHCSVNGLFVPFFSMWLIEKKWNNRLLLTHESDNRFW